MRQTRSSNPELEPFDREIDRTLHRRVRQQEEQIMAKRMNNNPLFDQARNPPGGGNNPDGNNRGEDPQENNGGGNRQVVPERFRHPYRRGEYGDEAPLIDSYIPQIPQGYNAIGRQEIEAPNFELKHGVILMAQGLGFSGAINEDPYLHLESLNEIADTIKINGVSRDAICLKLFPFSLRDRAKRWLQGLDRNSVNSWEELATIFLQKFFPPSKTSQLKIEIAQFKQFDLENLYETWERFKEMLKRCPQHGFTEGDKVQIFYNGLNGPTRTYLDAAAGGAMLMLGPLQATDLIETMAMNTYQWPNERNQPRKTAANVSGVDEVSALRADFTAFKTTVLNAIRGGEPSNCSAVHEVDEVEDVNFVNRQLMNRPTQLSNTYSPAWRNYKNFSYANNKNVLNPPPGFNAQQRYPTPHQQKMQQRAMVPAPQTWVAPQDSSRLDEIRTYMKKSEEKNEARFSALETQSVSNQAQMRSIETMMA